MAPDMMAGGPNYALMGILILFFASIGVIAVGMIVYLDRTTPIEVKESRLWMSETKKRKKLNQFNFLDNFFLTRGGIRKIFGRVSELSVYTGAEARIITLKFYLSSLRMMTILFLVSAFVFKDLFNVLLVMTFAVVMKTMMVDKQIDKEHYKLLNQLLETLSSVRQSYLRLGSIPDAISEASVKPYLQRAFDEVYLILTATDSEERLEALLEASPFRIVQTFAVVCHLINKTGDSKDKNGSSNFIQAIDMLESEVRLEVRRLHLMKKKFSMISYLPIAPLVAIKGVEVFFSGTIPGTTAIYNGPLGYFSKVAIVLIAMINYVIIIKLNSAIPVKRDDRSGFGSSMLDFKRWSNFIGKLTPKKVRKVARKEKALKGALSMLDMKTLYSIKVINASIAFLAAIFVLFFATNLGKEFIWGSVQEASLVAGEPLTIEEVAERQRMDEIYMNTFPQLDERETLKFVDQYLSDLPEFDRQAQARRLTVKYEEYYNTYFHWWYILIAYGFALIGWMSPELGLKGRAWILKTEATEDVLQLQTLIAILMNTNIDTLDTIYWMTKNSRVHRRLLMDCYHEYPGDPRLALERLKSKVSLPEFKRLVDKLVLTIHQITLAEAFSDLANEREHVLRMREVAQNAAIESKRAVASPLAQAPLYLLAVLFILVPMAILGVREFMSAMQNFSF